jgi:hypothetical protein
MTVSLGDTSPDVFNDVIGISNASTRKQLRQLAAGLRVIVIFCMMSRLLLL